MGKYILWPFGKFCRYLVCFSRFGMLRQEKSGNPDSAACLQSQAVGPEMIRKNDQNFLKSRKK
jgi:hypothetical protein